MLLFGIPATRAPAPTGFLLLEDGGYLLNENGGRISLNESDTPSGFNIQWQKVYEYIGTTFRPTFNDIKYANGRYVAVGKVLESFNDRVYAITSVDGITWTEIPQSKFVGSTTLLNLQAFNSVEYSTALGKWILAATFTGYGGGPPDTPGTRFYQSSDMVTWTYTDALLVLSDLQYNGVRYAAKRFVNIFDGSIIHYATSLASWTAPTFPSVGGSSFKAGNLDQVEGTFFALGVFAEDGGKVLYSNDGVTWQQFESAINFDRIYRFQGRWWAIDGTAVPYYSYDMVTWTQAVFSAPASCRGMAYANGIYLVGGTSGSSSLIATSRDGINFDVQIGSGPEASGSVQHLLSANGKFLWQHAGLDAQRIYLSQ
jgi:hypothetical protein